MNKSFINIEKSAFRHKQYVGYGGNAVWRIRKDGSTWIAEEQSGYRRIVCSTLTEVSERLEKFD